MYKDFYQLKSEPFSTHPDPGVIFISNTHKEAWEYLLSSMETQEPYLVLTGEYGMGKTLLCLRLIQVLRKTGKPPVEYIATPNEGYDGILRRIASSLGISPIPEVVSLLQSEIYDHFRAHIGNTRIYLMIDDAQELEPSELTRLKQLSTFNHNGFFPVSIIFVAHPSFLEVLKIPVLSSLNQRIKRRYHLSRFSFDDTKNYIYFRLLKSGSTGIPAFPEESLQMIFTASGGVPRLINNICDTCLLMGASRKLTVIPLSLVEQAVAMVEGSLSDSGPENNPVSGEDSEESTTITETAQTGINADSDFLAEMPADNEKMQSENSRHKGSSGFGKKLGRMAMLAAAALLLLAAGVLISRLIFKDDPLSTFFPPGRSSEKHQVISATPVPEPAESPAPAPSPEYVPVRPETAGRESSFLQQKTAPKVPFALLSPAGQWETMDADAGHPSSTEISEADVPLPSIAPLTSPEPPESVNFPYSLKSSSYQQPYRAGQELAEIRRQGLTPYLVRVDLGDMGIWWRVYIGFFASEEAALKAKAQYKLSHVTIEKTDYTCQIGEFSAETGLVKMFDRLNKSDYFPYVIQKGKDRFLLYVGAYETKTEAEFEHRNLLNNGFKNQIVKR